MTAGGSLTIAIVALYSLQFIINELLNLIPFSLRWLYLKPIIKMHACAYMSADALAP